MNAPAFILPTSGPATYRGKFPARARTVSAGATGLHVELNDGTRLWTAWAEIGRALVMADERNAMAAALQALAIVANETAHCVGKPGTMARDEMDSALAAAFALLNAPRAESGL